MSGRRIVIYTDLDGTLLDHQTYSFAESLPALAAAARAGVPVIFCSSKTRAETEHLRRLMNVTTPFIIENGAATIIPAGYLPSLAWDQPRDGDPTVTIGTPYRLLVEKLRELQAAFPGQIVGFSDMTEEEVARDCGLTVEEARRAKQREYDEPFKLVNAGTPPLRRLADAILQLGLTWSRGGRYYHLHGNNDKGTAVRILNRMLWRADAELFTVGLGDSLNDLPMLSAVDHPVLVRRPDGSHHRAVIEQLPEVRLTDGIGPRGWREAVTDLFNDAGFNQAAQE